MKKLKADRCRGEESDLGREVTSKKTSCRSFGNSTLFANLLKVEVSLSPSGCFVPQAKKRLAGSNMSNMSKALAVKQETPGNWQPAKAVLATGNLFGSLTFICFNFEVP